LSHLYTQLNHQHAAKRRKRKEGGWTGEEGRERSCEEISRDQGWGKHTRLFGSLNHYRWTPFQEAKEAAKWADGSKGTNKKVASAEEKRAADLARKEENARLLALEEASAPAKVVKAPKAGAKKAVVAPKPAGPGAIAAGGGLGTVKNGPAEKEDVESFAATGLDNALDLLDVVTSKMDKASIGQQAAGIEQHPERRFKVSSY
jgi:hypothetical protein